MIVLISGRSYIRGKIKVGNVDAKWSQKNVQPSVIVLIIVRRLYSQRSIENNRAQRKILQLAQLVNQPRDFYMGAAQKYNAQQVLDISSTVNKKFEQEHTYEQATKLNQEWKDNHNSKTDHVKVIDQKFLQRKFR